jgi:hypothetical protein
MAIGDVSFGVECKHRSMYRKDEWIELEWCDLYADALDFALKMQRENGDECRIIRYTSLPEGDRRRHKTKIVAVFKPMP